MSVYLPEWLDGYESFLFYGDINWLPQIKLKDDPDDENHLLVAVALFDVHSIAELIKKLGPYTGHDFFNRFCYSSSTIFKLLHLDDFLKNNLNTVLKETNRDYDAASEKLEDLFNQHIIEFEFWNRTDLVTIYANLIFYGTLEYPNPLIFFIPPKSKWKEYSKGWFGYSPFQER